jgi:hypothetical protein
LAPAVPCGRRFALCAHRLSRQVLQKRRKGNPTLPPRVGSGVAFSLLPSPYLTLPGPFAMFCSPWSDDSLSRMLIRLGRLLSR